MRLSCSGLQAIMKQYQKTAGREELHGSLLEQGCVDCYIFRHPCTWKPLNSWSCLAQILIKQETVLGVQMKPMLQDVDHRSCKIIELPSIISHRKDWRPGNVKQVHISFIKQLRGQIIKTGKKPDAVKINTGLQIYSVWRLIAQEIYGEPKSVFFQVVAIQVIDTDLPRFL